MIGPDTVEFESLGSGNWQVISCRQQTVAVSDNSGNFAGIQAGGVNVLQVGATIANFNVQTQIVSKQFSTAMGAAIASATSITLGTDGNLFSITGTTTIQTIVTTGWQAGSTVRLVFAGICIVNNSGNITFRAGATSITTAANDIRDFTWDGSKWRCGA
jgi:hypothetical protein